MADEPLRPSFIGLYPSDWKGGTAHLSPIQEWTYLQICLHNWDKGEPLPKRHQAGVLGRNPQWETTVAELVDMDKVTATASGGLFVRRAMAAYRAAFNLVEKRSKAGSKGAEVRWNSDTKPKSKAKPKPNPDDDGRNGDLIFSVDPELWRDFKEHRRKVGAPMTKRAEDGILAKLEAIRDQLGHKPEDVLLQSIIKGWRDVFPLKGEGNGNGPGDGRGLFNATRG